MNKKLDSLNIDLLILKPDIIKSLMEIKTRDVFSQNSTEFHHEGLFSTTIFGEVGSKERMSTFAFIDLGIEILHPRVYKELTSLSSLYKGMLEGTAYGIFDKKEKDFIPSDRVDGKTGFYSFMEHYDEIKYKLTDSIQREFKVKFLSNYKANEVIMNKYLVLPAGLRDYKLLESGKSMENEINNLYRKMLSIASSAKVFKNDVRNKDNEYISAVRKRLQKIAIDIYDYIENLLDGKSKFIQGKWTKRAIMYSTRNVITAAPVEIKDFNSDDNVRSIDSQVGLYQTTKGLLPITIFNTRTRFLQSIFDLNSTKAMLIDPKTLKKVPANISEKTRSRWVTDDGIEETINKLMQDEIKNAPIMVDGYYLLLVYEHENKIDILESIDVPGVEIDPKNVRPITYGELFYLSIFNIVKDYPAYVTRYPIVNYGGIVPTIPYLKTTLKVKKRLVRLPNTMDYIKANDYPIVGDRWFSSLAIPQIFLDALGADQKFYI